ncbi:hypothetical protein ABK040_005409 [Willaertia magna]
MGKEEKWKLRDEVKDMFEYAYSGYMKYAFPLDELCPLSCKGVNTWGNYSLTLIDALDTLYVMGMHDEFKKGVIYVIDNFKDFNLNVHTSVFETNIRILGGLLSSHLLALKHDWYKQFEKHNLLSLSVDLAERLILAFETPTGIPYGMVHLQLGVFKNESNLTSTASAGTFLLEFGLLSLLTNNTKYYDIAKRSTIALFLKRDPESNLVGNHINIIHGTYSHRDSGIGANIDSFFEYLYKGFILFYDEQLLEMFNVCYSSIMQYVYRKPWYLDVDMKLTKVTFAIYNSLASFWPGIQALYGDYETAKDTINAVHGVWRKYGCLPEGFNLYMGVAQHGQKPYPLRPELIESIYYLYKKSSGRDSTYLYMARDFMRGLQVVTKTKCGYAIVKDVETKVLEDRMESFFLSETLKYLYLIFDDENFVHFDQNTKQDTLLFTFNTEAHLIPLDIENYLKQHNISVKLDFFTKQSDLLLH